MRITLLLFIKDLLLFLRKPGEIPEDERTGVTDGTRFWLVIFVKFAVAVFISLPLIYLVDMFLLPLRHSDASVSLDNHNLFVLFIIVVLFAPVTEEMVFRYPLKFFRRRYLKSAVFISSITFGLVHSLNYENDTILFYALLPIIVSSQSAGGFLLAYLRLRQGLLWSMFAHGLYNGILLLLSVVLSHDRLVLNEKEPYYTLEVREYIYRQDRAKLRIHRSNEGIDSIIWKQANLQLLVDSLSNGQLQADQTLVDVELRTTRPLAADSIIMLLRKEFRIE